MASTSERHILSLLLENESGALLCVAGLFSARGYNIESLSVGNCVSDPTLARMTIVATGSKDQVGQIVQQLNKLVDVVEVLDITKDYVEREMILVKLHHEGNSASQKIKQLIGDSGARIVEEKDDYHILELVAPTGKIDSFVTRLSDYKFSEAVRSGIIGLGRGRVILDAGK